MIHNKSFNINTNIFSISNIIIKSEFILNKYHQYESIYIKIIIPFHYT